jgi:hypothetical protein
MRQRHVYWSRASEKPRYQIRSRTGNGDLLAVKVALAAVLASVGVVPFYAEPSPTGFLDGADVFDGRAIAIYAYSLTDMLHAMEVHGL